MRRAVFIDRDGVICQNRADHVKSWEEFVFLPGVLHSIARMAHSTMAIVVVTNQAIINRRIVTAATVEDIHARMVQAIEAHGGRIDRVMVCPHRPEEGCDCRKPKPGLLLRAARELDVDLARSYLIGDARTDLQAAWAVGCQPYLVLTGRGRRQLAQCLHPGGGHFYLSPDLATVIQALQAIQHSVEPAFYTQAPLALTRSSGP